MRMISGDVTGSVLLLIVLCWVAAGSMGPKRDEKAVKFSGAFLRTLDCPNETSIPDLQNLQSQAPMVVGSVRNIIIKKGSELFNKVLKRPLGQFMNPDVFEKITSDLIRPTVVASKEHELVALYDEDSKMTRATLAYIRHNIHNRVYTRKEHQTIYRMLTDKTMKRLSLESSLAIPTSVQIQWDSYVKSGHDKGHGIPCLAVRSDPEALDIVSTSVFLFPQARWLNRIHWKAMEKMMVAYLNKLALEHGGIQECFIVTLTSDQVISLSEDGLSYIFKRELMNELPGQVPIPNSILQMAFFPIIIGGYLIEVQYVAYFANNSDEVSKALCKLITLDVIAEWIGTSILGKASGVRFRQVKF